MAFQIQPTMFTPRQAAQITGVSVEKQRDWRRHGYLPETEGHARFDAYQLAELFFVEKMGVAGIGPKRAFEFSEICATGIVWTALGNPNSYSGDHLNLIDKQLVQPVIWTEQDHIELEKTVRDMGKEIGNYSDTLQQMNATRQAEFLQRYITNMYRGRVRTGEYFILWADGSELWHHDLNKAFDSIPHQDERRNGPVIVFSLESLGHQFAEKSQLPLFDVKVKL